MPHASTNGRPTERDEEILLHVSRYRLTTRKVLHELFFADSQINAVSKVTTKLVDRGYLREWPAPGEPKKHPKYFSAGPAAAGRYGIPRKVASRGPFGPQSLPTRLGILLFCCAGPIKRQCLTTKEVRAYKEALVAKGVQASQYYFEDFGGQRSTALGQIRVDTDSDPAVLVRNCERDLNVRRTHAVYDYLIENGSYHFSIVTATESKREAIRDAFDRRDWGPVSVYVECQPDLADFLMPVLQR